MLNSFRDLMPFLNMIMQQQHMDLFSIVWMGWDAKGADFVTNFHRRLMSKAYVAYCDYVLG